MKDIGAMLTHEIQNLRESIAAIDSTLAEMQLAIKGSVTMGLKHAVKGDVKADHLRAHRRGVPSKIDADPELRAFIIARLNTHTFTAICSEAAAHFPPDRRTSLTALSRWWQREGQHLPTEPQNIT